MADNGSGWTEEQQQRLRGAAPVPDGLEVVLMRRELQVLRQLALGLPNREIALMLGISTETVKEHVGSIFSRKLAISDRTKAAIRQFTRVWIEPLPAQPPIDVRKT